MKVPYIRVDQKGEIFFLTKFNALELKKQVNFHVRDPYLHKDNGSRDKYEEYISKLETKGIAFQNTEKEVQRRLSLSRINDIKEFIGKTSNFFPNTVLLSIDVTKDSEFEENYLDYESNEVGFFRFSDNAKFMIIDGQHRLAGVFSSSDEVMKELEIPAVVIFNVSLSTAAKLFADINGKVKPVNRSLVYDLYEDIDGLDYEYIKKIQSICKAFYENRTSPLYRQIKMLGIGSGAISQAFFIDYVSRALKIANIDGENKQFIYSQLYYYFTSFQALFPEDWPVPFGKDKNVEDLESHAIKVLKENKSQLVKTNGFGAIMLLFPVVFKKILDKKNNEIERIKFEDYLEILNPLKERIKWRQNDTIAQGTGKKNQSIILNEMKAILNIK